MLWASPSCQFHSAQPVGRWVRKEKMRRRGQLLLPLFTMSPIHVVRALGEGVCSRKVKGVLIPHLSIHCLHKSMERNIFAKYSQNTANESLLFPNKETKQDPWILSHPLIIHYGCLRVIRRLAGSWKSDSYESDLLRSSFAPENSKDQDKPLPMPLNKWVSGQSLQCLIRLPLAQ